MFVCKWRLCELCWHIGLCFYLCDYCMLSYLCMSTFVCTGRLTVLGSWMYELHATLIWWQYCDATPLICMCFCWCPPNMNAIGDLGDLDMVECRCRGAGDGTACTASDRRRTCALFDTCQRIRSSSSSTSCRRARRTSRAVPCSDFSPEELQKIKMGDLRKLFKDYL